MGSKYPRSLRCCLPLWALMLQVTFILLFYFFIEDTAQVDHKFMAIYQVLQDLTLVAALGFGFLSSSFQRHSWSSVAFNFFMLVLGVQGTILLDHFLRLVFKLSMVKVNDLSSIQIATMSTLPVLISAGAVLGKVNLVQLVVMVLMEAMAFGAIRFADYKVFNIKDHVIMMHGHVFGAYFGLTVGWWLSRSLPRKLHETGKIQMSKSSSLFAMLGTLFLWIFWPTINSALLVGTDDKKNAVFNTYYALAVSTVTATSLSSLSHPQGKINMVHIHNAVLAGGVAVGAPSSLISSPWIAMVLGLTAGLISIWGAKFPRACSNHVLQNPSGIHHTFGLPGLLGAVTYYCLQITTESSFSQFWIATRTVTDIGALSFAVAMGMVTGLLTGCLLSVKVWRAPHAAKYFDDQTFWEENRPGAASAPSHMNTRDKGLL